MALVAWPGVWPSNFTEGSEWSRITHFGLTPVEGPSIVNWSKWRLTMTFAPITHEQRNVLSRAIAALATGSAMRVPWGPYQKKIGAGSGTPSVSGAHNAGATQVATVGWSGSDPVFAAGDMAMFQTSVGGVLIPTIHGVTADVNATGSPAEWIVPIWPPTHFALADQQAVYFLGRVPAENATTYLELAMSIPDPSSFEIQDFLSRMGEDYGVPADLTLVESVRTAY